MRKITIFITLLAFFSLPKASFSKKPEENFLNLDQVVNAAVLNYPTILSQYDKIRAAESDLLAAEGSFDVMLRQNYNSKTKGYYDGNAYDAEIGKYLGAFGSSVFGGYRKSYGKFADYDGDLETNESGEFRVGAKFSLLKDRDIDKNRLSIILGNLGIEESKIALEGIKMEIARDATKAYWSWVAAGKIFQIYEDLYQLALKRQNQLEIKSKRGDVAQIVVVENKKNLLKRQAALARNKQKFETNSLYLSLFWRDKNGNPIRPHISNLPDIDPILSNIPTSVEITNSKQQAAAKRPEIRLMNIKNDQQLKELKYAQNLMQPQLDVEVGASKDGGNGPQSRSQSNNYANLNFSLPLQRSEAKGKTASVQAKISAIKYEKSLLEDRVNTEIDQIAIKIDTIAQTYSLLVEEAELSEVLQFSELEKFNHGASNFFLVNMREQDLASSRAAVIEVFKEFNNAKADYKFAIFDYDLPENK